MVVLVLWVWRLLELLLLADSSVVFFFFFRRGSSWVQFHVVQYASSRARLVGRWPPNSAAISAAAVRVVGVRDRLESVWYEEDGVEGWRREPEEEAEEEEEEAGEERGSSGVSLRMDRWQS